VTVVWNILQVHCARANCSYDLNTKVNMNFLAPVLKTILFCNVRSDTSVLPKAYSFLNSQEFRPVTSEGETPQTENQALFYTIYRSCNYYKVGVPEPLPDRKPKTLKLATSLEGCKETIQVTYAILK